MKKLTANDPETKSADVVAENIAHLQAIFPEAFTEGRIDFAVLRQLLGGAVDDSPEKYGLNWHGKRAFRQLALTPSTGTLLPCEAESVDWDTTQNLMIEGDNLEVLKLLQKSYANAVKVIYLDPPYNTGNDFIYPDDFRDNIENYKTNTEQDFTSKPETGGRFHTAWLNMMYPRLILARNLLKKEGVIFVSIDDNEVHHLRAFMNEVFGEENFLAALIHQRAKGGGQAKQVVRGHDYILVFARNLASAAPLRKKKVVQGRTEVIDGKEYMINDDVVRKQFGKYDKSLGDRRCFYEELVQYKGAGKKKEIDERIEKGELYLEKRPDGKHIICERILVDDASSKLYSIIKVLSEEGKKDLDRLSIAGFDYPKPVDLVKQLVESATERDGDLVMDFFAGSGTTGQAVLDLNSLDDGTRRYILVQLPQPTNRAEFKTIAEITKERLRRAANKIKEEHPEYIGDLGFRVFKLDSSNIKAWDPNREVTNENLLSHTEHLVEGRTDEDVLYELLLKLGLDLTVPIEEKTIGGHTVYSIGLGKLIVCLANDVTHKAVEPLAMGIIKWHEELKPEGDVSLVFKDSGFADDVSKSNLTAILEQHGLKNVRSI